tara:strand:+ start:282 stop:446 length:165 start_codon:yes stop_codon:yes gene_type:complete
MGQMKAYAMWLEEKGYVELVPMPDGHEDYRNTERHPGDAVAVREFMEERDARKS